MGISHFDPNTNRVLQKIQQLEQVVEKRADATSYRTAFIRNLNEPYTTPVNRTLLQNDGQRAGGINTFGFNIWDTGTQTLKPNKINERYFVRLSFALKCAVSCVVDIDIEAGGFIIGSPSRFQLHAMNEWETQSRLFSFFVGGAFAPDGENIVNGAQFFISPSEPVEVNNLSYDIFTFGGGST